MTQAVRKRSRGSEWGLFSRGWSDVLRSDIFRIEVVPPGVLLGGSTNCTTSRPYRGGK